MESNLAQMRHRRLNEQIRYFKPHGGQLEFLQEINREGAFIAILGGGNGWGKSEMLAAIFAAAMWPNLAPSCFGETLLNWKHPKRARIYSKPAELAEIGSLQTAIARLFPKGRYTIAKGQYGYPNVFKTDTGWVLDLFSYERHESEAAGPNIGLQAFNEPPPEPLWKEAVARSRAGGIILGGMTSLYDNPWVVDGLLGKADGKNIRVRYGSSCENCKQHGINGNLEHDQIEKVLSQYDADEREARFSGKPLSMSGAIFKTFNPKFHVLPEVVRPSGDVQIVQVVDPAGGKPLAVIWAFADIAGNITIFDEWPNTPFFGAKDPGLSPSQYAELFRAKEAGFKVDRRIIDRRYGNATHKPGAKTIREDFRDLGFEYDNSYSVGQDKPEMETGILKVVEYLKFDKEKPIDSINHPRLLISPNCTNTAHSLARWTRDPKTYKPLDNGYKDFCDTTIYLAMAEPKYEPPIVWGARSEAFHGV